MLARHSKGQGTMNGITRRMMMGAGAALAASGTGAFAATGPATAWSFSFPSLDGGTLDFGASRGRVLLVVNTASFCGYTYQYEGLEKLHRDVGPRGLTVIGIPSQDFGQESADNHTVKTFCDATFGVEFPMTSIMHVRGPGANPFHAWVRQVRAWEPQWNFNKVLIGRDGLIKATYGAPVEPGAPALMTPLEAELNRPTA
jgi:glutathione peroxidase